MPSQVSTEVIRDDHIAEEQRNQEQDGGLIRLKTLQNAWATHPADDTAAGQLRPDFRAAESA